MDEKKDNTMFEGILKNTSLVEPAKEAEGKDIVLILGMAGSGKTTLAAYLAGNEMKRVVVNRQARVVPCDEKLADKIGHSIAAKTSIPEFYPFSNSEILFGDFPGFEDNRGAKERIEASLSTELVIKKASSIKAVVIVIPADRVISERGEGLKNIAELLGNLADLSSLKNAVYFLITHKEKMGGVEEEDRLDVLKEKTNEVYELYAKDFGKRVRELNAIALSEDSRKNELAVLENMLKTLSCLKTACDNNRFGIVNWFNSSTRQDVMQWLMSLNVPIDVRAFDFSRYDETRANFDDYVKNILETSIFDFREVDFLNHKFQLLEGNRKNSEVKKTLKNVEKKIKEKNISEAANGLDEILISQANYLVKYKESRNKIQEEIEENLMLTKKLFEKLEGEVDTGNFFENALNDPSFSKKTILKLNAIKEKINALLLGNLALKRNSFGGSFSEYQAVSRDLSSQFFARDFDINLKRVPCTFLSGNQLLSNILLILKTDEKTKALLTKPSNKYASILMLKNQIFPPKELDKSTIYIVNNNDTIQTCWYEDGKMKITNIIERAKCDQIISFFNNDVLIEKSNNELFDEVALLCGCPLENSTESLTLNVGEEHIIKVENISLVKVGTIFSFIIDEKGYIGRGYSIIKEGADNWDQEVNIVGELSWYDYIKPHSTIHKVEEMMKEEELFPSFSPLTAYKWGNMIAFGGVSFLVDIVTKPLGGTANAILTDQIKQVNSKFFKEKDLFPFGGSYPICREISAQNTWTFKRPNFLIRVCEYYSSYWLMPSTLQTITLIQNNLNRLVNELEMFDENIDETKKYIDKIEQLKSAVSKNDDLKSAEVMGAISEISNSDSELDNKISKDLDSLDKLLKEKINFLKSNADLYAAINNSYEILGERNKKFITAFLEEYKKCDILLSSVNEQSNLKTTADNLPVPIFTDKGNSVVTASDSGLSEVEQKIETSRKLQQSGHFAQAKELIEEAIRNPIPNDKFEKLLPGYRGYYIALEKGPQDAYLFFEQALKVFSTVYANDPQPKTAAIMVEIMLKLGRLYHLPTTDTLSTVPQVVFKRKESLFNQVKSRTVNVSVFFEELKHYCESGEDINALDELHNTFLHHAVMQRHHVIANKLLELNASFDIQNSMLMTALDIAIRDDNREILTCFWEKEVQQFKQSESKNYQILHKIIVHLPVDMKFIANLLSQNDVALNQRWLLTEYQGKALWELVCQLNPEKISPTKLLELFIARDSQMDMQLLVAFVKAKNVALCQFAFERWDKNLLDLNRVLPDQKTLLSLATLSNNWKMVQLLLNQGADINQSFGYYTTEIFAQKRKGFFSITPEILKQKMELPNHFIIGQAVESGGCFFDSLAQALNSARNTQTYTEKSLRELCYEYYLSNQQEVMQWHLADYRPGASVPSYVQVQYTDEELQGKTPLWGRAHIEGVILCRMLNLPAIYVAELIPDPGTKQPTIAYYEINQKHYQSIATSVVAPTTTAAATTVTMSTATTTLTQAVNFSPEMLMLVASKNDLHFVPVLPEAVAYQIHFVSPTRFAILERNLPMVKCLLSYKPNLRERNEHLHTLMHTAVLMGHVEIMKAIYQSSPENERFSLLLDKDSQGNTPLHLAVQNGHQTCFQWIVKTTMAYRENVKESSVKVESPNQIFSEQNHAGDIPLKLAVQNHNVDIVDTLCHLPGIGFWNNNQAHQALQLAMLDKSIPATIVNEMSASKVQHCISLVKSHMEAFLNNTPFYKPFISTWVNRLKEVIKEEQYGVYRGTLTKIAMFPLQKMAEKLAITITHAIKEKYQTDEDKKLLNTNIEQGTYHAWDQLLREAIDKNVALISSKITPKTSFFSSSNLAGTSVTTVANTSITTPLIVQFKNDKHRAFTRTLKEALRNYFYVSRALYEGKVLMNDANFNAFKAAFNIAAPAISSEVGSMAPNLHIGVIASVIGASLELITKLKEAKYQCEAGRFVQSFGMCAPGAIEKGEKDIPINHENLKLVAETLYQRYRDQIQECSLSKESETIISVAKTDGISVLAHVMADRIFQHMIKKGSIVDDDRTVTKQVLDWVKTLASDNDIYRELPLIGLPERCVMAVLCECVSDDKSRHIRTDKWLKDRANQVNVWQAGGVLVKTGLKLERNSGELYVRKGDEAHKSLQDKYGYCYVSENMITLKEIEKRKFEKASKTESDMFSDQVSESESQALQQCFIV